MDKMFIERKHGREKVSYPHPALKDVLDNTYGVMLYQEDVLAVARELAGFTVPEADDLRKAIGKKQMDKIGKFRQAFVAGAEKTNDVQRNVSDQIYTDIEKFGGYGFNRAHAASYAMVSYVTAYLKVHYPAHYMAALLTTVTDKKPKMAAYLYECRRMGLNVLSPDIVKSKENFEVLNEKDILFGLTAIDGVGGAIVRAIYRDRKEEYSSLLDYFRLCDPAILNKRTIEHLSAAGAFDSLLSDSYKVRLDRPEKLGVLEKEKKELGIYVTDHPLLEVWDFFSDKTDLTIADLDASYNGATIKLPGIVSHVEKKTTKRGQKMYVLEFQDLAGAMEVVVFPNVASRLDDDFLVSGDIGVLEGQLSVEGDDEDSITYKMFYNSFEKLDAAAIRGSRPILLESGQKLTSGQLKKIGDIIGRVRGDSPVYFTYPEGRHKVTLRFKQSTDLEVEDALKAIVALSAIGNGV
jgi:DNA polymerase-3 subunit alpha